MDNKEYGVKLSADITDLEKKLKKAQILTNEAKKSIEEPLRKVKIDREGEIEELKIKANTKPLERQLEETAEAFEKRMANIKPKIFDNSFYNPSADRGDDAFKEWYGESVLNDNAYWKRFSKEKGGPVGYDLSIFKEEAEDLKNKLEEVNNVDLSEAKDEVKDLGDSVKDVKEETDDTKEGFSNLGDSISRTVKKSITNLKRFSLSLLGIHSVWTALSRAVRSYMAYDKEANQRLQANWVALGAMFAPIVERIVKWIQTLVAYINVFYKALTGKDFIQKALEKVKAKIDGTTKSVKNLNKELANIDEITNLNFDQGTENDLGIANSLQELQEMQLDPQIVKTIEDIAKKVKQFYEDYIKPLIDAIGEISKGFKEWGFGLDDVIWLAGTLFGAFAFAKIYGEISKIIGVPGGTTGLYGMLTLFGMLIDFQLAYKLGQELEEYVDVLFETKEHNEELGDEEVKRLRKNKERLTEIENQLKNNNLSEEERNKLEEKKARLIENSKEEYQNFNEAVATGKYRTKEQRDEVNKLAREIEYITNTHWKSEIDLYIKAVSKDWLTQKIIDFMFGGIYGALNDWNLFGIEVKKGRNYGSSSNHFAKGNVAYEPTQAEFGEYAGARSNPEITAPQNIMKQTMIEALQEAMPQGTSRGGDAVLVVNGKELARATFNDYQNEAKRLGTSNVAIRRV